MEMSKKSLTIKMAICIVFPLIIYCLPTGGFDGLYTPLIRNYFVATLFAILLMATELLPSMITAVLLVMSYLLIGVPGTTVFSPWTTNIFWAVIGGFIFAYALEETGLIYRVVYKVMTICGGSFKRMIFLLYIVGAAITYLTFNSSPMMQIVIFTSIITAMGWEKKPQGIMIMLTLQMSGIGVACWCYTPIYVGIFEQMGSLIFQGYTFNWYYPTLYSGIPLNIIAFISLYVWMKMLKLDKTLLEGGKEYFVEQGRKLGPMRSSEKKAAVISIIIFALLFTSNLTGIGVHYIFCLVSAFFFVPRLGCNVDKCLNKINFGILVFITACMSIGTAGAAIGVADLFSVAVTPFLSYIPKMVFPLGILFMGIVANVLMTPMAFISLLSLPLAQLSMDLGFSSPTAALLVLLMTSDLIFLPYETTNTVIYFSYGYMSLVDFIKFSSVKVLITVVGFVVLVMPCYYLFGLLS